MMALAPSLLTVPASPSSGEATGMSDGGNVIEMIVRLPARMRDKIVETLSGSSAVR